MNQLEIDTKLAGVAAANVLGILLEHMRQEGRLDAKTLAHVASEAVRIAPDTAAIVRRIIPPHDPPVGGEPEAGAPG